MGQSRNTELQLFSGGLHLRPEPHLINPSESRKLSNINVRSLTLKPYRTPLFVEYVNEPFMFYFNGKFHFHSLWRSNILWNRTWYWSSNAATGKVLRDGTELPLGINPPTKKLVLEETTPGEGDEGLTGVMTYVYTYYHKDTGAESPPSPPSTSIRVADKTVTLSGFIPSTDYHIRIYRLGGIITAYTAVETVSGQVAEYIDRKKFSEIEATILTTMRAYPPPIGLHLLTESHGRFFGCVDSKLYYSAAGKPDSWYALDFISFDEGITMIAAVSNGLLVATTTQTWIITGQTPRSFGKYAISESEGCMSPISVNVLDGTAIWLSGNGFMMSNGTQIQNISIGKLGAIKGLDPLGCVVYDRMYIISFGGSLTPGGELVPGPDGGEDDDPDVGGLVPGATSGSSHFSQGAIIIDFSFGEPVFSTLEQAGLGSMGFFNNKLYQIIQFPTELGHISTEDGDSKIVTENGHFNIVADLKGSATLVEAFAGFDLTRIDYISPLLSDGSIGMLKQYEKVRITFLGAIEVTVLNDNGETMQDQTLIATRRDSKWLGIPVGNNRGYGIQIKIKGLGVVDSIMYTWTPWETQ